MRAAPGAGAAYRKLLTPVRIIILLNPAAGRHKARGRLHRALEVLRRAGEKPEIEESRSAAHLVELARQAAAARPDLVVSAGGDGTHHFVLNGVWGSETPLGVLSLGSGNDLVKSLGIPVEPGAAARLLLKGKPWRIDLARVGTIVYGCIAGVGFDSVVTHYANERVKRVHGPLAYAWSLVRCLDEYRAHQLEISSGSEERFSGEIIFTTVGNTVSYGGGLRMAPFAKPDDGLLDVCIVTRMSKLELLRWVPATYRGTQLRNPRILYFQASTVSLESPSRLELFGDGEYIQDLPAKIEVEPRALSVMARR